MKAVRTTFKLAPKTVDEEYDVRKKAMKDLKEALGTYKKAMESAKHAAKEVMTSMGNVKRVFDMMTQGSQTADSTRSLALAFGSSSDRVTSAYYPQFVQSMDSEVMPAINELKKLHDACSKYESERNKIRSEYDVYRNEVSKKEREYAKKGKDLTASKSYGSDVVKRNDLRGRFEGADLTFKGAHDNLSNTASEATERCIAAFLKASTAFAGSMTRELEALYRGTGYVDS